MSTHSAPFGTRWKPAGEKGSTRVWKYVAMIFAVLVMSVGQMWGETDYILGLFNVSGGNVALTKNSFGTNGALVYNGSSLSTTTAVSFKTSGGDAVTKGSIYYTTNTLTQANCTTATNAGTSSSDGYVRGFQIAVNSTYTLALGDVTATDIYIIGRFAKKQDASNVITIKNSSSETIGNISNNNSTGTNLTPNHFSGTFTGNITIQNTSTNSNDEYRALIYIIASDGGGGGGGCTSITPTWSTDYSSTMLNVGATSSTPVVGKDGSSGAVTFSSSDTYIATVNSSGVVTGVGAGTATITATVAADGGKCEGTVTKSFTIKAGITYNGNSQTSGSVPTDATKYAANADITVLGNTGSLTKTDKVFNGWNTRSDGTGTHYDVGATIKMPEKSAGLVLHAEWVGYATSWEWWNSGQSHESTTFTYLTNKNYICSFKSSASTAVASWDITGTIVYRGVKMKTKDHYMYFWVPTGKRVSITFGYMSTKPTFTVGGVNKAGDLTTSTTDSATVTYTTTADTKFYIENETATKTAFTVKSVKIEDDATCPSAYSFHYGPAVGAWETPICFEKVGSTHEWNITNFTIPDHTNGQFYVGYEGSTNDQSATKAWTDSYSESNGVGNGAMLLLPTNGSVVGNAVGATGTLVIWENSSSKNQYVGFKPDGYSIRYSGTDHVFTETATANKWETDVVTLPNVSTTYTMEIATEDGYTTCYHSNAPEAISAMGVTNVAGGKKAIYLVPGSFNVLGTEKYAIYDKTADAFSSDFMKDDDGDGIYVGYVSSGCTSIILVRMSADATTSELASKDWTHKWNQTKGSGIAISGDLAKKFTITSLDGDNCNYSTANMQPITGQKGKFRMWANSNDNNWYVHFIPYYVLSYDANGGSGTTAATERNSESSTLTVSVASNGFTAPTGKHFVNWGTTTSGGTTYTAGASYSLTADATLYAQWAWNTYDVSASLTNVTVKSGTTGTGAATHGSAYSVTLQGETGYNLPASVTVTIGGETATLTTDYTWDSSTGVLTVLAAKVTGNISISATGAAQVYDITYKDQGDADFSGSHADGYPTTHTYGSSTTLKGATKTGYTFGGWFGNSECTGDAVTSLGATDYTADITLYAKWTVNKFDVTHTLSNVSRSSGDEAGSNKATYGTEYSVTFAASSGYTLPDAVTVTVGGSNVTANCTWNQGTGELTIPAAYVTGAIVITVTGEEEGGGDCTPINASITFDNNKSAKYNTAWAASDITTSGGAVFAQVGVGTDTHKNSKMALKLDSDGDSLKLTIPDGITSGNITIKACTYDGRSGFIKIRKNGTELSSTEVGLVGETKTYKITNEDAAEWSEPILKTVSYDITSGGVYSIKRTTNSVYIYAFSATGTKECDDEPAGEDPIPALISYYLQTPNTSTTPASLSTDSIVTTPKRLKGDTLKNFVPVTLGSSLGITGKGKDDKNQYTAKIGKAPADSTTTAANEIKLAFEVHDDYELNISSITLTGMTVGNDNTLTYRAKLTDGVTSVVGRIATIGGGADRTVVFESFSGKKFSGTVTLSLWVWGVANCDYRIKSPIQIDGTLTRKATACTMPTQTFSTGAYTLGGDALDLSTLFSSNSSGAVTYSVVNAGGTSATIVGHSFTASNTGTATIRATQAADGVGNYCAKSIETTITVSGDCTPQSLVKTVMSSTKAGTTTGYNDGEYAGEPVIATFEDSPTDGGYKLKSGSKLFVTLKKGNFVAGDKINIVITKASDLTITTTGKLLIFYNASTPALLKTIDAASAGTYTYTLTDDDITTLGSTKTIGVFRSSGTTENNPYVKSVEVAGCRDWTVCTAPDAVVAGSETHNSAVLTVTDAEETGNYEFYYSTSNTAPTASTVALATGSALTKTITGLTASTTYYYWVRSNCGGVTKSAWVAGTPATFTTTTAASTYSVTYNGNSNTSGSVPTDATAYEEGDIVTVKGNTGSLAKTGNSFVGWNTSSDGTGVFYPAGYKFYMGNANVTLYAVWGSVGATCVTLTNFATSSSTSSVPDGQSRYFYGYPNSSMSDEDRILITTDGNSDCRGQSDGTIMRLNYGKKIRIYSSSSTTTYSGITAISFKWRFYSTGNGGKTEETSSYTVKVVGGSTTTVANAVSITGKSKDDYRTVNITGLSSLNGYVEITAGGSSSNHHLYLDDIQICYGSGASSGHTVSFNMNGHGSEIADIENVPNGSKIGAPVPEPTAADYDFGGWYKDDELSDDWDFANDQVTGNTTLYAKWGNCAPTITTHPVSANYNQNGVASALTVVAATNGGGDLNYQWWVKENDLAEEDGSAIPGETGNSFTPSTVLLGTSYYYCVVSNDCGNVKTNTAAVTIRDAKPDPKAIWTVTEPTHGGKGFTFSVEVNKDDDENWDGTLEASMLTLSSEAVLDESSIVVDNTNKTISGTYGVKGSATSPVTFYLLLPATDTQAAKRLDCDRSFDKCVGGSGDSYDIRVRKTTTKDGNYYHWANTHGWISQKISSSFSSEKASTKMGESNQFDSIYNTNGQYVWVRTYHANINKVRIYADFRANDMTVSNVYKHTDYFSEASKYIVGYTVVYNDDTDAANLGDADLKYVDITLEEPMNANDIVLVKFNDAKVRTLGAVLTEGRSGGSIETALVWSNSQENGARVEKNEDALDFTITADRSGEDALASLGAINYSSSVPSVATVNAATGAVHIADNIDFGGEDYKETTITALLNPSGCYKRSSITYVLRVNKYVCTEAAGTIASVDRGCAGMDLTITGYEDGASIQWYKDGSPVGTNNATYNATEPGEYYAITNKTCDAMSTNSVVLARPTASATKIVDSWYIKNGRRTPDIALVQTTNATGFTVTTGSPASDITSTGIGGCTFELKDDGIIYLHGTQDNGDAPSDMTPGDMTITITATACNNATPLDIVLHIQAETVKPSIAFVVDGTLRKDGGTATSVLAAKTSERPIWKYLNATFDLTGCNAYWSVNSKELRQYYSQFDAILITDDPNTTTKGTGDVSYVKAFGTMVDVRPVLTMEAYVGKFSDGGWHVYNATPTSPNPRQVEMKLECKNHDIFKGLNPATSDNVRTTTDEYGNEYWHVIMVDTTQSPYHNTKDSYEALPALQGFDRTKFSNMLGVGTIFEEKLQAGVERQEEPAARMMILGIQNNAMAALTNEGKLVVRNALEYLLKTNMEDVNDCSNYFTGAEDDQWNNLANWTGDALPDFETRVRILKPVVVPDGCQAVVARVDIATSGASKHVTGECNGSVTINPTGALIVGGKIRRAEAPHFGVDNLEPTENDDLIVKASTTAPHNQGALIFDNSDGDTHAVVEMWNPSHWEVDGGKKKKYWSYVAVPIQEADIPNFFWYGFTYLYDETSGWIKKSDGTSLYPFQGIGASLQTGHMETFYGPLATTESQDITLTYTAGKGQGMNLIGNSWTAPIQIANFEEDDFGDAAAEVWVFNTGHTNGGHSTMADGSAGTTTAGQWQTIPIGVAGLPGYTGLKVIPAMQAFEVNTESETTLHLDYDRLVRAGRENLNEPMRAPRRSAAKQLEGTLRVRVSGEVTHTDVYLLKDARFSDAFDNGWDGHYLFGDDRSASLYAVSETEGAMAFLAQPEIDGTILGFAPSRYGNDYTFTFYYLGEEEYYLNDIKLQKSTLISEDESYMFTFEEGDTNRFYISKTPINAPSVATGTENTGDGVKARKVLVNDKLYIILNGRVYSAEGVMVK